MKSLLEMALGMVVGGLFALLLAYALFSSDSYEENHSKRAKKSQCSAYEKVLQENPSATTLNGHRLSEIYAKMCKEE